MANSLKGMVKRMVEFVDAVLRPDPIHTRRRADQIVEGQWVYFLSGGKVVKTFRPFFGRRRIQAKFGIEDLRIEGDLNARSLENYK